MEMNLIRDEVKVKLTGGILDLEINDETLDKVINSAFREVQRYITTTRIMKGLNGKQVQHSCQFGWK